MKIITIIGARPQFIKAAPVSQNLKIVGINEIIVHTGQHYDENMSRVFFEELKIPAPDYNLNINSLSHGAMTGRMLEGIEKVLLQEKPDLVMVYGDTNSTLAGALAAKKLHIKVAHVEAGLRSYNMKMPEEVNRILTDRISDILFCPTTEAVTNLSKEGFSIMDCMVKNSGDVMYDSFLQFKELSDKMSFVTSKLDLQHQNYVLFTCHREENTETEEAFEAIINILNNLATRVEVVFPVHPRIEKKMSNFKLNPKVKTTPPLGYLDMVSLLSHCQMVVTDSGGLQKEAYFSRKFCITLREETEWVELTKSDVNVLCGNNLQKAMGAYDRYSKTEFSTDTCLYGNGKASIVIAETLKQILNRGEIVN